jgi:hypothetical protein
MIDFAVDWQNYEGQWVIVTGGVVNFASIDGAMLYTSGVSIPIRPPFREREDLRYLLTHCTGVEINRPETKCAMEVFGRVGKLPYSNEPAIFDPDLPVN